MHTAPVVTAVIAIVALLLVGAAAAIGFRRTNLPYTVGLVLVGLLIGTLAERTEALAPLEQITLSPEIILFVFLPTLIFESAFNLDSRLLTKNLAPVLVLAAPGLLLSATIVGGVIAAATALPLTSALVFGALISATDPVAVIALFKEIGAPKRLQILVEGESLFNDATAIVLFRIILFSAGALSLATIAGGVAAFLVVFTGGLAVGAAIGYLMIRSVALARDDPLVQVALSTVVAYAAFIAADHYLRVSGVMATVGAGLVIGVLSSTRFTPDVRAYLHQFWEYAAFVANSLIFLLVGMSIRPGLLLEYAGPIGWAIVAVIVARLATVFGLIPIVTRLPGAEPIDWRYRGVLFWGGLRGAVALALALSLPADFAGRDLVVALALGVVLFTLLAGGLTMKRLIGALGLDRPGLVERVARAQARLEAKREALDRLASLEGGEDCSSSLVADVAAPYRAAAGAAVRELAALRTECGPAEIERVLWSEALSAEQRTYRELFEQAAMSEAVLHELVLAVELARDGLERGVLPTEVRSVMPLEHRVAGWLVGRLERIAPRNRMVQRHRVRALAARYEHDAAVLEVSSRVVREVDHLATLSGVAPEVLARCRAAYERRGQAAMERIDTMAQHFPEYVHAVQVHCARRIALDAETDAIERLRVRGGLPPSVTRSARGAVERARRELERQPVAGLEPRPEELLARVPFFQGLGPDDAARVVALLVPRTVLQGRDIVRQDERGTSLFLIARGVVAVLVSRFGRPPKRVASLYPGDFFGEMAILTAEPRLATVRCVTDCQVYELTKRDVDRLCELCAGVREALERTHAQRSHDLATRRWSGAMATPETPLPESPATGGDA